MPRKSLRRIGRQLRIARLKLISLRPSIVLLISTIAAIGITLILALLMDDFKNFRDSQFPVASYDFLDESMKAIGAAFLAGAVALFISNSWQQKSVGIELLKELNSPEFMVVRNALSMQMKMAKANGWDLENLTGWFPKEPTDPKSDEEKDNEEKMRQGNFSLIEDDVFIRTHALASMVYFVVRLSNYARAGMLNLFISRPLFRAFFVHYRLVILEFATAVERQYSSIYQQRRTKNHREIMSGMWLRRIEDLRFFFAFIGLDSELDDEHNYQYFKSLRSKGTDLKPRFACDEYSKKYEIKRDIKFKVKESVDLPEEKLANTVLPGLVGIKSTHEPLGLGAARAARAAKFHTD